jgi:hypothetical protein
MRRYVSLRARNSIKSYLDEGEFEYYAVNGNTSITVHEQECTARQTGLLDKDGNALYALEERLPIGFTKNYIR